MRPDDDMMFAFGCIVAILLIAGFVIHVCY